MLTSVPPAVLEHHRRLCRRTPRSAATEAALWPEATPTQRDWADRFYEGAQLLASFDEPRALSLLSQCASACAYGPTAVRATVLDSLAAVHFQLNDYPRALVAARDAQSTWRQLGEVALCAQSQAWVGATLVALTRYREGLQALHASLEQHAGQVARAHLGLGVLYAQLEDHGRAVAHFSSALEQATEEQDLELQGRVLASWGEAHLRRRQPTEALGLLTRAVGVLRGLAAHCHLGRGLISISKAHRQLGNDEAALAAAREALAAVERGYAPQAKVAVYAGLGELLSERGAQQEGVSLLSRALEEANRLGVHQESYRAHKLLSEAFKRAGDYPRALEHHEAFHEQRSIIFDELAREKIDTLRAEFELQKVQAARELERSQSIELAAAYARLAQQAEQLARLSVRDALTGLFNRRHFDEALTLELQRARAFSASLSLMLVDIDTFKRINDEWGHLVGDAVLKRLAGVLMRELRQSDLATRYGGEEFGLILPHTALDGARIAAEKLRRAVEEQTWPELAPASLKVTISIGLAQWTGTETMLQLIERADDALYAAKAAGRNRVVAAESPAPPPANV